MALGHDSGSNGHLARVGQASTAIKTIDDQASPHVLTLPGWLGSGPGHWQNRWEVLHGCTRVEQHDWQRPLRGDWTARLQEVLLAQPAPVLLAAHSLGCLLAAW